MRPTKKIASNDIGADGPEEICTVRIELVDTDPLIWRVVEVLTSVTLKVLHDVIQIAMGWLDCDLWEFTVGPRTYGLSADEDWRTAPRTKATKVRLRDVLRPRKTTTGYMYDFGDSWVHRLTVIGIRLGEPGVSYPNYIGREWNAPPEDCGGIPGFYGMLDTLADPKHPDHGEMAEQLEGWDPKEIDVTPLKVGLGRIAKRRQAARARIAEQVT